MRRRLSIGIAAGTLALASAFVPTATASADDGEKTRIPTGDLPISAMTASPPDGKAKASVKRDQVKGSLPSSDGVTPAAATICGPDELCCEGFYQPQAWLDVSSPRRIHVGGRINCNYIDTGLWFTINAYSVRGSGPNATLRFEDQWHQPDRTSSTTGNSWVEPCIGTTSTRWVFATYYHADVVGALIPYPLWTNQLIFACGAG